MTLRPLNTSSLTTAFDGSILDDFDMGNAAVSAVLADKSSDDDEEGAGQGWVRKKA